MHQLDKFKKLFEESSAVKPFSFDYDGEKLDLSSVNGVMERKNDRQFRMIYDVIPNLLRVILEVNTFDDFPVIEYTPYVENIGKTDTGIISDFSSLDYAVKVASLLGKQKSNTSNGFDSDHITIRYFHGAHAANSDFLPFNKEYIFVRSLRQRYKEIVAQSGRGSSSFLPYIGLDTDSMNGINLAIGWNSSWKFRTEGDGDSSGRVRCGMKYSHFRLHPGEKLLQPGILLHFREGKSIRDSQNEFRRFILKHNSPRNSKGELFKPPVSLLLWGGFETEKQLIVLDIDNLIYSPLLRIELPVYGKAA